jgi:hypothetical protein
MVGAVLRGGGESRLLHLPHPSHRDARGPQAALGPGQRTFPERRRGKRAALPSVAQAVRHQQLRENDERSQGRL